VYTVYKRLEGCQGKSVDCGEATSRVFLIKRERISTGLKSFFAVFPKSPEKAFNGYLRHRKKEAIHVFRDYFP
jgi:hypothetical protein